MARATPIKDFLFRMRVDPDFANRVVDPDPAVRELAFTEYGLDLATRNAIEGPTPIKDFLFRLEVDADFVNSVLDILENPDPAQRDTDLDAVLEELELEEPTRTAIKTAIGSRDFHQLQDLVLAEDPDTDTVLILPKAWVR